MSSSLPAFPLHSQTVDRWWGDADVCTIPGPAPLRYPANSEGANYCGGGAPLASMPLADANSTRYGSIRVFRTLDDELLVTVQLEGSRHGQWFFEPANDTGGDGVGPGKWGPRG
jgi:hypothetical protein